MHWAAPPSAASAYPAAPASVGCVVCRGRGMQELSNALGCATVSGVSLPSGTCHKACEPRQVERQAAGSEVHEAIHTWAAMLVCGFAPHLASITAEPTCSTLVSRSSGAPKGSGIYDHTSQLPRHHPPAARL